MEKIIDKGCGLDVHQATVVACIQSKGHPKQIRTFGTTTEDLEELKQWLKETGTTHVAMESTGIYWRPIFNVLEDEQWEILLVNARHIKNVPGRKTDVKDWPMDLQIVTVGLVAGEFYTTGRYTAIALIHTASKEAPRADTTGKEPDT